MPRLSFVCCLVFSAFLLSAQTARPAIDSNLNYAVNQRFAAYLDSVREGSRIYTGADYTGTYAAAAGFPFFQSEKPLLAQLYYNSVHYPQVRLSLDLERDVVVIPQYAQQNAQMLIAHDIDSFRIGDHVFISLITDSSQHDQPPAGIYERLTTGRLTILEKRRKRLKVTGKPEENRSQYVEDVSFFSLRDNSYRAISSQKDFFNLFGTREAEIKKWLRQQDLRFKKDATSTLKQAVQYYNDTNN